MYTCEDCGNSLEEGVIKLDTNTLLSQYVNSAVLCNAKNAVVGSGGLAVH